MMNYKNERCRARIKYKSDKIFLVFLLLTFADLLFFCCNEMRESRDFDLRNLIIIFLYRIYNFSVLSIHSIFMIFNLLAYIYIYI